jgi:hypothetical protein
MKYIIIFKNKLPNRSRYKYFLLWKIIIPMIGQENDFR